MTAAALPLKRLFPSKWRSASVLWLLFATQLVAAQGAHSVAAAGAAAVAAAPDRDLSDWLLRLHAASMRNRAYIGTVVLSAGGNMSSARIWHVCEGDQQMERVENLTGAPRSTFRHNAQVVTFLPDAKIARTERRESLGLFPDVLKASGGSIPAFYEARVQGTERVAGLEAQVVSLQPKDALRYGYRLWTDKKTSLVVKLQTLDGAGKVLEQAAFSELQLDAPVRMEKLAQMMAATEGYKLENTELVKTTALAEGWVLANAVPGFAPVSCFKRSGATGNPAASTLQWVFSDGLASVSLFVEPFDRTRHLQEVSVTTGATQTLTRKQPDAATGRDWWLTAVGEVPAATLKAFALGLERKK